MISCPFLLLSLYFYLCRGKLSESGWLRDRKEGQELNVTEELYVKNSECMPTLSPPRC